ncbi:MAG: hypothetical protein AB7F78_21045, partial [Hyphomicrobiaceae bacterium]
LQRAAFSFSACRIKDFLENFLDFFRASRPRTFGCQLGVNHTIRFYRTRREIRRYILSDVRRDERKRIGFQTMSIDSREEQHE